MNDDPMRWHSNISAEVLSLMISEMSVRYLRMLIAGNLPKATAHQIVDEVFAQSLAAAMAWGSVDALEAASAAEKGRLQ